jgi:hypothetical protein
MKGKVNPSSYKTSVTVDNSKDFSNWIKVSQMISGKGKLE